MRAPVLHVVSVSGGKDSAATAILALETMPRESLRFVFADTGNEHESTLEYVADTRRKRNDGAGRVQAVRGASVFTWGGE